MPVNIFIDTEFMEDGKTIEPLSLGACAEVNDATELFYIEIDSDRSKANDWVKANVLPMLGDNPVPREMAAYEFLQWVQHVCEKARDPFPRFWGYFADYDWIVVCQLFGTMMDLPNGWPMLCLDLKQEAMAIGDGHPRLPEQKRNEHHALHDALWNLEVFNFLKTKAMRWA